MLYEKLNPEMQRTVDEFAGRIAALSWSRRSDALSRAALPFSDQLDDSHARLAGQGFVTAVLERLEWSTVVDPHQAVLLRLSLNPTHRAEAESWLAAHPDLREVVDRELGEDG